MTLLQQCSTGRHSSLPGMPFAVGAQCGKLTLLIYHLRPYDHIADALVTVHRLHVPEHVQYKIAVLTFKVLHDSVPRHLGPIVIVTDLPGRRAMRSASTSCLVVPPIKLSTVGSHAFPVAAAQVWNGL